MTHILTKITDLSELKNILDSFTSESKISILNHTSNLNSEESFFTLTETKDLAKFSSYQIFFNAEFQPDWNFFCTNFKGITYCFDVKNLLKTFSEFNLNLPAKALDIMLASYVYNSSKSNLIKDQLFYFSNLENFSNYNLSENDETGIQILKLGLVYSTILDQKQAFMWKELESPLAFILAKIELYGVYIDKNSLNKISSDLFEQTKNLENDIKLELNSAELNLNSPTQLGKILTERGFELNKSTAKGKISTDKNTLEKLVLQDSTGIIAKILTYRTLSKLYSTYTESFIGQLDSNNRLHTQYNQAQVATGRLSSSNPNLQNIPIKNPVYGPLIRSCFAAENGNLLISADYSQIELRILAHFSKDPTLIDAFRQNQDIHTRTAAEIFEIEIDKVSKEQRRLGKTLNFALIYQQGAFATAEQLGIEHKQAAEFIKKYFIRFPRVKPFIEEVLTEARLNNYVETLFGRRRYFENLNSKQAILRKLEERAAFNAVLQGTSADITKLAMIKVSNKYEENMLNAQIILQVHDELVVEAQSDQANLARSILIEEMFLNQPLYVPILVEAGIGENWSKCK